MLYAGSEFKPVILDCILESKQKEYQLHFCVLLLKQPLNGYQVILYLYGYDLLKFPENSYKSQFYEIFCTCRCYTTLDKLLKLVQSNGEQVLRST